MIGSGTLLAKADLMFGPIARDWQIDVIDDYSGMLMAILPPGAFIGLGFLIALKNIIDSRKPKQSAVAEIPVQVVTEAE